MEWLGARGKRPEPWNRNEPLHREDVEGSLHITLADGVYVDALNMNARLQNQIRSLATFRNPVFDSMYNKRLAAYRKLGFTIADQERTEKQQAESIYNGWDYLDTFERDLNEADRQIIIASPGLTQDKVDRLISILKERQEAGVEVVVITASPDEARFSDSSFVTSMIGELKQAGIIARIQENLEDHYAVIDGDLVWYGGMNLLGKADAWDNLIRVKDVQAAAELMEMSLGKEEMCFFRIGRKHASYVPASMTRTSQGIFPGKGSESLCLGPSLRYSAVGTRTHRTKSLKCSNGKEERAASFFS